MLRGFARTRANLALEIPQQSELTTVNILEGSKHGETSIPGRKFWAVFPEIFAALLFVMPRYRK